MTRHMPGTRMPVKTWLLASALIVGLQIALISLARAWGVTDA